MSVIEISSIVASFVSVGIGIMAIWLSIEFYKMSSKLSGDANEAAKDIKSSVERLENLFDRLYSDTFSMMKETVTDMRRHIWPNESDSMEKQVDKINKEAEIKADEKVEDIKEEVKEQLSDILVRQSSAEAKLLEVENILDRVIKESRNAENKAREETIREHINRELIILKRHGEEGVTADYLLNRLMRRGFSPAVVFREFNNMKDEGLISWQGKLKPDTAIELIS